VKRYVHGAGIDEILVQTQGSIDAFYHHDALGSTVLLTNASGNIVRSYEYDVFGQVSNPPSLDDMFSADPYANRFLYTGREFLKEANLYDYRNRVYSAELGRFLQTDPIRFDAGDVNLYRYVGNGSLNWVDAVGLKFTIDPSAPKDWRSKTQKDLNKVERDLKKNAKDNPKDPCAQKAYKDFMDLKNDPSYNVTITPTTGGNTYDPSTNTIEFNAWKPTGGTDADGSNLRDASIGLGHEIGHAIDDKDGGINYGPAKDPTRFPNHAEETAVNFENEIRNGRWPNDPGRQRLKY
jgi:RHS repeat-associated protein